jgi:hypothetical protein
MNRSETIGKLSAALLKAQASMSNAIKDSKNPFFKSSYANLNSVREAVTPALNANGITVLQPINGDIVETILMHESGEYLMSHTRIVTNKENDAQNYGSAISYARRYGLQSFLSIGADDDDGEKAMGRGGNMPATMKATTVAATPARVTFQKQSVTKPAVAGDDI